MRTALLFLTLCVAFCAQAANKSVVSLVAENDVITGTDRHYTSGVLLSYVSGINRGPDRFTDLGRRLPMIDDDDDLHFGFSIGHEIYTPRDIDVAALIEEDRPYAGHLYAAADFTISNPRALSTWRLNLGIVGPSSKAEEIQTDLHRRIGAETPEGWDNQLKDEFAYGILYEKQWRPLCDTQCTGWGADLLPHVGFSLGNVSTYANVGAIFRVGRNLSSDYGPPRIRPALPGSMFFSPNADGITWYFYLGADGRYQRVKPNGTARRSQSQLMDKARAHEAMTAETEHRPKKKKKRRAARKKSKSGSRP